MSGRRERGRPPETGPQRSVRWLMGGWFLEPRRGYRCSPELELVPDFLEAGWARGRVLDLGTGAGALLICALPLAGDEPWTAVGLELQAPLAALARDNLALRGLTPRARIVQGDVRDAPLAAGHWDRVLCNPPFFPQGWGRPSARSAKQLATHEVAGGLEDFLATTSAALRPGGRALFVYAADRLTRLLAALPSAGLSALRTLVVRHEQRETLCRVFVELSKPPHEGQPSPGLEVQERSYDFLAARG